MTAIAIPIETADVGQEHELEVRQLVSTPTLVVVDVLTCQQAVDLRADIKTRQARILEFFKPLKDAAYKAHKALTSREAEVLAPLNTFDDALKRSIGDWNRVEEARKKSEEMRLGELARSRAEEIASREAAALEAAGHAEEARAVIEEAIAAPPPVINLQPLSKQVVGFKTRREWRWRYVGNDPVKALSRIPREYLCVDEKKVAGVVRALKGEAKIPGIEVFYEDVPVR